MAHSNSSGHQMSMKINSLEIWCYDCKKWTGENSSSHEAEKYKVRQVQEHFLKATTGITDFDFLEVFLLNQKRQRERSMRFRLLPDEKAYFINVQFMIHWRQFLLGNSNPPGFIDNSPLVWPPVMRPSQEDKAAVSKFESGILESGWPMAVNPLVNSLEHFAITNEELWNYLKVEYGGGPALTEDNIPKGNPLFRELREDFIYLKERMQAMREENDTDDEQSSDQFEDEDGDMASDGDGGEF
ncbi:hypothetical protein BC829DRAFT_392693 [Chytridium lagenaria]|nr:hypothetical protein BC829DRAFT_392693 [Chytridium lagenaria]